MKEYSKHVGNTANSSKQMKMRRDFLDQDAIDLIKKKREECLKEQGSCGTCVFGTKKFDKIACSVKSNKLVNTYNYCENWKK